MYQIQYINKISLQKKHEGWIEPIPLIALQDIFALWKPVTHHREECGSAYHYGKPDLLLRINQMCQHEDITKKTFDNRKIFLIDAETLLLEDWDQWEKLLKSQSNEECLFLIVGADYILTENRYDIATHFELYRNQNVHHSFLFFFMIDFTQPEYYKIIKSKSVFTQNMIFHPIHSLEVTDHFVKHMAWTWNLSISNKLRKFIVTNCGGDFYFPKQALRMVRDNIKLESIEDMLANKGMDQKLQIVWNRFSFNQQSVFKKLLTKDNKFTEDEKHCLEFLRTTGWVKGNASTIPLLDAFIKKNIKTNTLHLDEHSNICINNIPLSKEFSEAEQRILTFFINNKEAILDREQLGDLIWADKSDDMYSEWSIDQYISRLRKKILKLHLNVTIKTIKGRGYEYYG